MKILINQKLLKIQTNQIRAQLSNLGHPIVSALKYGSNVNCQMKWGCFKLVFNAKNTELNYLNDLTIN